MNKAEEHLHEVMSSQRIPELLSRGTIKRRREPEELGSEDERDYQLEESNEESRAEAEE